MINRYKLALTGIMACASLVLSSSLSAQAYPTKPIKILTAPIGGALDIAARTVIAPGIQQGLNQSVIVENRQGVTGINAAAKSAPDGYTLLVHGSIVWLQQFLNANTPWDPIKDFEPVTMAMFVPNILVVPPTLPVGTVKELVALAKAKPGQLNYASGANGTITHLAGEMFKSMTGTYIVRIPYGGTGGGLKAMMAGEVHMMFPAVASGMALVKAGKLKALAVTTLKPSKLAPGLPTMSQAGLPGFESGASTAVLAPAKTPKAIITQLHRAISGYLNNAQVAEKLAKQSIEVDGGTPEELTATIKSDIDKWGKVIRDAGIRG